MKRARRSRVEGGGARVVGALTACALLVAACGAPAGPRSTEVVLAPRRASSAPVPSEGVEPTVEWPASLALPSAEACVFRQTAFAGPLGLTASSKPFITVDEDATSTTHLPAQLGAAAIVEVDAGPLRLRGAIDPTAIDLHLRRGRALRGVVWLHPTATLRIARIEPEPALLLVRLVDPVVELVGLPDPVESVACDDLGTAVGDFTVLPLDHPVLAEALLVGQGVPLRRGPTGTPVGTLVLDTAAPPRVRVLIRERGQSMIVWEREDWTIAGWVPDTATRSAPPEAERPMSATGRMWGDEGGGHRFACDDELVLGIRGPEGFVRVGALAPRAPFAVPERAGLLVRVAVSARGASPAEGVSFWARASDVDRCLRHTPDQRSASAVLSRTAATARGPRR